MMINAVRKVTRAYHQFNWLLKGAFSFIPLFKGRNMTTVNRPQVLFWKTLSKTRNFFCRTLQNLRSFQPNPPLYVNPFYNICNSSRKSIPEFDDSNGCFSDQLESSNHDEVFEKRENRSTTLSLSPKVQMMMEDGECSQSHHSNTAEREISSVVENTKKLEGGGKEKEKELKNLHLHWKNKDLCRSGAHYSLAQKMKELEMLEVDMEEEDAVDHLLDIEEVFHHYAQLKCPVYQQLVDKFFMDMYYEFILPVSQPLVRSTSIRRL